MTWETYCIASTSENLSTAFKSYCRNTGDDFLGFLFSGLVFLKLAEYRIDWYGIEAMRRTSTLEAAISGVASLLRGAIGEAASLLMGAINDRG